MAQLPSVVLKDPSSALTATFVPSAGMVCTSLSDGGVELLGQRRGLRAYLTTGKTMGIPILYPWANRLSANGYAVDGGAVTLTPLLQDHGGIDSYGFRIGRFAYSNDVAQLPAETLDALDGLDVWIVDALRYTPHPTHAHVERTLGWVERLKPRRAVLTNLHVDLDYRTLERDLPAGVEPAHDGWRVDIPQ
jgi:hypothetical protein